MSIMAASPSIHVSGSEPSLSLPCPLGKRREITIMIDNNETAKILVVDDDENVVAYLVEMLVQAGYSTTGSTEPYKAIDIINQQEFDIVIADIRMPDLSGPDLLKAIQAQKSEQLLIFITAFGNIELAVEMVKAGACDFIAKPFKIEVLLMAIDKALRERSLRREIVRLRRATSPNGDSEHLVAHSSCLRHVVDLAYRAARSEASVLLTGESGVGKNVVAKYIHKPSARSEKPFVEINCAALPATLVESELFGVRKGAFTDAKENRPGLFVKAEGGTLLLDEIGEMPIESQPKLLHALEKSKIRPIGASSEIAIDVRIIAATNQALEESLKRHRFRPDLYYRLNIIRIEIPPLRERIEDIEALVDLFLDRYSHRMGRPIVGISSKAMRRLLSYEWPGNVRELANVIERAVVLTEHDTIMTHDIDPHPSPRKLDASDEVFLPGTLAEMERRFIHQTIDAAGGNKKLAAKILNIDRRTLYRKLDRVDTTE